MQMFEGDSSILGQHFWSRVQYKLCIFETSQKTQTIQIRFWLGRERANKRCPLRPASGDRCSGHLSLRSHAPKLQRTSQVSLNSRRLTPSSPTRMAPLGSKQCGLLAKLPALQGQRPAPAVARVWPRNSGDHWKNTVKCDP